MMVAAALAEAVLPATPVVVSNASVCPNAAATNAVRTAAAEIAGVVILVTPARRGPASARRVVTENNAGPMVVVDPAAPASQAIAVYRVSVFPMKAAVEILRPLVNARELRSSPVWMEPWMSRTASIAVVGRTRLP